MKILQKILDILNVKEFKLTNMETHKIIKISIVLLLLTISIFPNGLSNNNVKTIYVDNEDGKDYKNIKDALENANSGDTIFVYNGTYSEYFTINKSINLIGENKEQTIIQHNVSAYSTHLIKITADNVKVSGFKIKGNFNKTLENNIGSPIPPTFNQDIGIFIGSNNNEINNCIFENWGYGILLNHSKNTIILNNNITDHHISSIFLDDSSKNIIINNNIKNNKIGITLHVNSTDNIIYHNNFINNTYYHVFSERDNIFYNDTLKQGNYYDDYIGTDRNNDGIGDTPYNISGEISIDLFPIMSPYYGRVVVKNFYIDQEVVIYMLWIAMIVTIIFLIPIAYIWYRKTKPRK